MSASKLAPLSILLLLALPCSAQQEDEVERLRAENSVLRLELRALRKRLETLEDRLDKFLATREAREPTWPDAAQGSPGPKPLPAGGQMALSADGQDLIDPNLRLPDDAGGATPQQLIEAWALAMADVAALEGAERAKALRELATRFGAYGAKSPYPFLIPDSVWGKCRGGAPRSPVSGDLLLMSEALVAGGQPTGRVLEIQVYSSAPKRTERKPVDILAAWLGLRCNGSSSGPEASGATVHGLVAGSPAMKVSKEGDSLKVNDTIESVSFGGQVRLTPTREKLYEAIAAAGPGSKITLATKRLRATENGYVYDDRTVTLTLIGKREDTSKHRASSVTREVRFRLEGSSNTFDEVRVQAVKLNGRWLLVSAEIPSLGNDVAECFRLLTQKFPFYARMSHEKRDKLFEVMRAGLKLLEAKLPVYDFRLYRKGEEDFGLIARPRMAGYPVVSYGYAGGYSPRESPYRVRIEAPPKK